jgi:hypothetical protein
MLDGLVGTGLFVQVHASFARGFAEHLQKCFSGKDLGDI